MRHLVSTTATTAAAEVTRPHPYVHQPRSPWHSPVPYLFGGLAAMLGLIAFALLILACSYWRLSTVGRLEDDRDPENGNHKEGSSSCEKSEKVYEEKFLVIMAGDKKPTFLATPVSNQACSFKTEKVEKGEGEKAENGEKVNKEGVSSTAGQEEEDQRSTSNNNGNYPALEGNGNREEETQQYQV